MRNFFQIVWLSLILVYCSGSNEEPQPIIDTSKIVGSWMLVSNLKDGVEQGTTAVHGVQCDQIYIWNFEEGGRFTSKFCLDFSEQEHPWSIEEQMDDRLLLKIDVGRSWIHGGYLMQLDETTLIFELIDANNLGEVRVRTFKRIR